MLGVGDVARLGIHIVLFLTVNVEHIWIHKHITRFGVSLIAIRQNRFFISISVSNYNVQLQFQFGFLIGNKIILLITIMDVKAWITFKHYT